MDKLKQFAIALRKAADIIDELVIAEESGMPDEVQLDLVDRFQLQMIKIQRMVEGL